MILLRQRSTCVCVCVFVCGRGGEVVRQTEQREKYLHEKGERFRREGGAGCQVLLPTAPLTARHKHNILHPWERYC